MRLVDIQLREGINMAGVDLFDRQHAEHVLGLFGQAIGKISDPATAEQKAFLRQVIDEIAQDGKVICVRIAVIAEMMKHRDWTLHDWEAVGRSAGVGETFLEETFASSTASPTHRLHQEGARHVLAAMLPTDDIEIKGDGCSYSKLLEASRYEDPREFQELLEILDDEVRLITPIEQHSNASTAGVQQAQREPASHQRHYQLTHDFLVPSLRGWLTSKQRETHSGRAELSLEQHTAWWTAHPESRFLPPIADWLKIRLWTKPNRWTEAQRSMMKRADGSVAVKTLFIAAVVAVMLTGAGLWSQRNATERNRLRADAQSFISRLTRADVNNVPDDLVEIREKPQLHEFMMDSLAVQENWRSSFAVLAISSNDDTARKSAAENITRAILTDELPLEDLMAIRESTLRTNSKDLFIDILWAAVSQGDSSNMSASVVLAGIDSTNPNWSNLARGVSRWLVNRPTGEMPKAIEALQSVGSKLIADLALRARQHEDVASSSSQNATSALVAYAQPTHVRDVMSVALPASKKQLASLLPWLRKHPNPVAAQCSGLLDLESNDRNDDAIFGAGSELNLLHKEFELLEGMLDVAHAFCPPIPRARFEEIVEKLQAQGYRLNRIRPSTVSGEQYFTAHWLRDGLQFDWEDNLSLDDLKARDRNQRKQGFLPIDVAITTTANGSRYCCLWVAGVPNLLDAKIEAGLSQQEVIQRAAENIRTSSERWMIRSVDVMPSAENKERFLLLSEEVADTEQMEGVDFGILTGRQRWVPNDFAFRLGSDSADVELQRHYKSDSLAPPERWKLMLYRGSVNPVSYIQDASRSTGNFVLQLKTSVTPNSESDTFLEQKVLLKPNTNYLFSGWIKTDGVEVFENGSHGAHLSLFAPGFKRESRSVEGTVDWTYVALHFRTEGPDKQRIPLGPRLGNNSSTARGTAWFDDLKLLELSPAEAESTEITKEVFLRELDNRKNLLRNGSFELVPPVVAARSQPTVQSGTIELASVQDHKRQARTFSNRGYEMQSLRPHLVGGEQFLASTWIRRGLPNAAVIYATCRGLDDVLHLLKSDVDANTRAFFISRLAVARYPLPDLISLIKNETDQAIKHGLLLSMDQVSLDAVSSRDAERLDALLSELRSDIDPGVRAAAAWLANRLDRQIPPGKREARDDTGIRWFVTQNSHRFVVLENHQNRFAISDAETTEEQFSKLDKYLKEKLKLTPVRTADAIRPNYPQEKMSFYAGAMYCRWLGEIEGLPEAEQHYPDLRVLTQLARERGEFKFRADPMARKRGYRLPTQFEWDWASGQATGDLIDARRHPSLMMEYAHFSHERAGVSSAPIRMKKPNLFGMFDMWGNVMEWTEPNPLERTTLYPVRGGSYRNPPPEATIYYIEHLSSNQARYGFRIARNWFED